MRDTSNDMQKMQSPQRMEGKKMTHKIGDKVWVIHGFEVLQAEVIECAVYIKCSFAGEIKWFPNGLIFTKEYAALHNLEYELQQALDIVRDRM